jgi:hypothetical protein
MRRVDASSVGFASFGDGAGAGVALSDFEQAATATSAPAAIQLRVAILMVAM